MTNAIKHAFDESGVTVFVALRVKDGGYLLQVRDELPGTLHVSFAEG